LKQIFEVVEYNIRQKNRSYVSRLHEVDVGCIVICQLPICLVDWQQRNTLIVNSFTADILASSSLLPTNGLLHCG